MHTVGQILRQRREEAGLTLAGLAQRVGAAKSYLSMIENHRVASPPSRQLLQALEQALDLRDGQLMRAAEWQTTPSRVRSQLQQQAEQARRGQELAAWLKQSLRRRKGGGKNLDEVFKNGELTRRINSALGRASSRAGDIEALTAPRHQVPLINKVAAGYPGDFTDLDYPARVADEYVSVPDLADPHAFAARVVGDSMTPDYRAGDIVVFSPQADVTDGCDCFVRLEPDHSTTFKRVFFEAQGRIRLQPLNPKFAPVSLPREQVTGLYRAVRKIQMI